MLEVQNTNQENNFPQKVSDEKSFSDEENSGELRIFNPQEWKHFINEVNKQFAEENSVDFEKATHNARYLAKLDRAFANIRAGRWVEHDLIEVDDDE